MAKFTQGEWKYYHHGTACINDIVSEDGQGFFNEIIAHLVIKDKDGGIAEVEANARLIAQAPKMYELLKNITETICYNASQHHLSTLVDFKSSFYDKAIEVLAEVDKK